MKRIGIYPGSFDPLTNGHLDIIERAKAICDTLIVAIARNSAKTPLFTVEERKEILGKCCRTDHIEITEFDGLLVDYCKSRDVSIIIRGLRAIVDFEYEYAMALMNKSLSEDIETVFLMAKSEYSFISSHMVKEVASYGGNITSLVPQFVNNKLQQKYSSNSS